MVLRDDVVPDIRVFLEIGCHARWHVRPGFDTEGFGQGRPHIAPLEHVAVSDVERLVRRPGRLRSQTITSATRSASAASQTNDGPPGKPNGSPFSRRIAA